VDEGDLGEMARADSRAERDVSEDGRDRQATIYAAGELDV